MAPVAAAPAKQAERQRREPTARERSAARAAAAAAPRRSAAKGAAAAPARQKRASRNSKALANARATQRAGAAPATRTAPARRKSGPAAKPRQRPQRAPQPQSSPVARVLNSRGMPLLDRLLRGRGWVLIVGALLAGIVFLNVSVLELNRGIAQTDAKSAALERTNSDLRSRVAKLDSGERIQQLAAKKGFVLPAPGDVTYVRPRPRLDAKLAAKRISEPAGETVATSGATAAPTTTTTTSAAVTAAPSSTAVAPAPATTTTVP